MAFQKLFEQSIEYHIVSLVQNTVNRVLKKITMPILYSVQ